MNALENRQWEMFGRVREFGAARVGDFAAGTLGQELFAALAQVMAQLETQATRQTSERNEAKKSTASKAAARASLLASLQALQRTARVLALTQPGLEKSFRLPGRMTDTMLLTTARAMAAQAAPLQGALARHELAADFLTALQAQITAMANTMTDRSEARSAQVTATASIGQTIEQGSRLVQQLEVIMRNKYAQEPQTLAAWETARRVTKGRAAAATANTQGGKSAATGGGATA
ncbi:MAG: hypothetical protein U0Y68_21605 [Blastocatellia bacterium]